LRPQHPSLLFPYTTLFRSYLAVLRSGDSRQLCSALEHGAPINGRDARGNTPLMWAMVYADAASARLLLDRGAEVNAANTAGATRSEEHTSELQSQSNLVCR